MLGWLTGVAVTPPAFAVAPACDVLFEGFESGTLGKFHTAGDAPGWSAVTTAAKTGTHSAFAPGVDGLSDQQLTLTNALVVPSGIIGGYVEFWHRFSIELSFDRAVIETSIDGGATWQDAGPFISGGGYDESIQPPSSNPLVGRNVWGGTNPS